MRAGVIGERSRDDANPSIDLELARRLWKYIHPQRGLLLASLSLLLITSGCRLTLPFLIKLAIDQHLTRGDMSGFWYLILIFVAVAVVEIIGSGLETWTVSLTGQNALLDLRIDVFKHLQRLSSSFYDRTPIGRLVGRVTTDIEALQEMFSSGVVTILGDIFFLITTLVILFALNWQLTLVALSVVPPLLAITLWIRIHVRAAYKRMISRRSRLNAYIHEQVSGMPIVQMFAREAYSREGFGRINDELRDAQLRSVRWESQLSALTELLGSLTLALILWYGSRLIIGASVAPDPLRDALTLGALFAFIDYMERFFVPLNDLSLKYTVMQNAMTASDRIFRLLDEDAITPESATPLPMAIPRGHIEFKNVSFGYADDEPVLKNVTFSVDPGERLAIVGATGAGKTTILKLLTRLYDIQQGAIEIDGVDVREFALRDLRRRIGIVPQDVFMFAGTILSNIVLGHPEVDDREAEGAADTLGLREVVSRFPNGYREPVSERGANLSSGERQLIAFARVLTAKPTVLALDEATSNVDTKTEQLLQEAVHTIMTGRTSLIIAHRLSTIRDADRILVLHRGCVVEEGTHEELLEARGHYWRLVQLQYQELGGPQNGDGGGPQNGDGGGHQPGGGGSQPGDGGGGQPGDGRPRSPQA